MNNLSRAALAVFIGAVCVPALALAAEMRVGEQPSFPIDAVLADDLYMAGGNVTSGGAIEGDLVSAGGTVLVSGDVSADAILVGGTITVIGSVGDDLRVGGGTITVQSAVADDVLMGGGQITLAGPGVGGDAIIGGGVVRIDAPVGGNVQAGGGEVYINARVAGDVSVHADKVTLGPQAHIQGNFSYSSPNEATLEDGAVVRGETFYEESPSARRSVAFGLLAFLSIAFLIKFVAIFISALILSLVFKRYAQELVTRAHAEPWRYLIWGLVFMIVLPVLSIALLVTLIGIPFGIIGLLTFVICMIFAAILAPVVIGAVVHKWIWKPDTYQISWRTILLGTFVYFLLKLIPFLGSLVLLGVMLIALGVAINIKKEALREWR
ncbi:MAG TPA: hypothetical protein VJK53_03230 [Candidatus Paceibacterota bacterium]